MFYGNNIEKYSDSLSESYIEPEDILSEFYKAYGEAMIVSESCEEEDDILSEGANIEITKKFKEFKENYNKYNKAGKKALKNKDVNDAAVNFAKAKKELKDFESAVKGMDSTVGSAVLGTLAGLTLSMVKVTITSFGPFAVLIGGSEALSKLTKMGSKVHNIARDVNHYTSLSSLALGPVILTINSLRELVGLIKEFTRRIKEGDKNADKFNLYRTELLRYIKKLDDSLDRYIKLVDHIMKKKKDEDK
jgi:hypothetical protein